ncbi:hypothetical protein MACH17_19120 [Phaeobacter inhibens]|uniref:hypothetical protein n=1 Tax=Phaeobacter inhibens TaxID=221822 RepID=UPI002766DDD6|nr:hypothetical protein [Phaeobacter inhibens]GLO70395.1 hypothetical protein MACH17_19120 [Phaeobacter inhibens]
MSISERDFNAVAAASPKKRDAPFSLRLSFEEKTALTKMAAGKPLGAYIKAVLFDEARTGVPRKSNGSANGLKGTTNRAVLARSGPCVKRWLAISDQFPRRLAQLNVR